MSSSSIVRLKLFFPLFAGGLLLLCITSAQSVAQDNWTVYMKDSPCAETLLDWMTVSDRHPSLPPSIFVPASHPKGTVFPHTPAGFAAAHLRADLLRVLGFLASGNVPRLAKYGSYCCKNWWVWRKRELDGTDKFTPVNGPLSPGQGFEIEAGPLCCEDAAVRAKQTFGCASFRTSTGQVVLFTENGAVSQGTQPIVLEDLVIPSMGGGTTEETKQIGCYKDTNAPFDLDGDLIRDPANTPKKCIEHCRNKGFAYAGVQYGESCLCGNSYGRYGPADNCNMPCTGDGSQTCGGFYANMVFSTGLPVPGTISDGGGAECKERCQSVSCSSGQLPLCKDQCGVSRWCRYESGGCAWCDPL
jgi:hypothetical protein